MPRSVVLHAADLHLDAPFENVGRTPPQVAAALRDAALATWDALVDLAIAREVAAVLLAGGLCGGIERGVRTQARLRDGLARLCARGIRAFVALGERDPPLAGFGAVGEWPEGVTVFPAGAWGTEVLTHAGAALATVHGISAAPQRGAALPELRVAGADLPTPHLAVCQSALVGHAADDGSVTACPPADLRGAGVDYWALGHAHALDYPSTVAPWIVYPGRPQGRGLAAEECGPKGVVLVEIDSGAVTRVDFEPIDRVRCLRVELRDAPDPAGLVELLSARAAALREHQLGRALVLDARVGGAAGASHALCQPAARAELLAALRRVAEPWEPFVWWAGVRRLPSARSGEPVGDDLAAEVERHRSLLAADGELRARFFARRFEPLRDAWTADIDPPEASALLDEAAAVAIDALHEDGS